MTCVLEDNEIEMDIECRGGRGNRKLIKMPSSGHLRYDRFIKNNPVHLIKLKNMMEELTCVLEDNETEMDIEYWGGRGNK